jgi:hypothetical protein
MEFSRPPLVVAFELSEKRKAIVADTLAGVSAVVYLTELDEAARAEALRNAGVLGPPRNGEDQVVIEPQAPDYWPRRD